MFYNEQCVNFKSIKRFTSLGHKTFTGNSYFYIEKRTFKGMCEVYYRAKRDKKEVTCL